MQLYWPALNGISASFIIQVSKIKDINRETNGKRTQKTVF